MAPYYSCIHRPVFPSQRSGYSSLSGALSPPPSPFQRSSRHRVPQLVAKAAGRPVCQPVFFDYVGSAQQGVFVSDFGSRSTHALAEMMAGSHDLPLADAPAVKEINLRIKVREELHLRWWVVDRLYRQWPGYEHLDWSSSTPASSSMTRVQLGASIALHFRRFVQVGGSASAHEGLLMPVLQKAMSATTTCSRWKIGSDGIGFEKIVLVGLYSIGGDVWQADVAIDDL